jgi:hypothetical protein
MCFFCKRHLEGELLDEAFPFRGKQKAKAKAVDSRFLLRKWDLLGLLQNSRKFYSSIFWQLPSLKIYC